MNYTPALVYRLLDHYDLIKEDYYQAPDHELKLALIDIDMAISNIPWKDEEKQCLEYWKQRIPLEKWNIHVSDRTKYRMKWEIAKKISFYLESEGEGKGK